MPHVAWPVAPSAVDTVPLFHQWTSFIDAQGSDKIKTSAATDEELRGFVGAMTAPSQTTVDAVLYDEEFKLLVLSQSKHRGLSKSDPGKLADTTLGNGGKDGVVNIVKSMRDQFALLVKRYPHLGAQGITVVYDVFSTKAEPARDTLTADRLELQPHECVCVTRGHRIVPVLGEALADLRDVKRQRAGT